jgi:hypothetical protein
MRSMRSRFIVSSLTVVVALLVELAMVNQGFARCDPYLCSDNPQSRPDHCSNGQRTIGPILRTKNFPAIVWRLPSNDNLREDRPDHNCVCPRDLACHPWYCFYRRAKAVYLTERIFGFTKLNGLVKATKDVGGDTETQGNTGSRMIRITPTTRMTPTKISATYRRHEAAEGGLRSAM